MHRAHAGVRTYARTRSGVQDLLAFFNDVQVDGVYETHVPLLFRALAELGCLCGVHRRNRVAETDFELGELQMRPTESNPYIEPGSLR